MSSKAVEKVSLREKEVSWDLEVDGKLDGGSGGGDRLVRREGDLGSEQASIAGDSNNDRERTRRRDVQVVEDQGFWGHTNFRVVTRVREDHYPTDVGRRLDRANVVRFVRWFNFDA